MILRRQRFSWTTYLGLLLSVHAVAAQDEPFNCLFQVNGISYDLRGLAGEHSVNRTRQTPPTEMVDSVLFNLCEDLKVQSGVSDKDQVWTRHCLCCNLMTEKVSYSLFQLCAPGTRVCLTKDNHKEGSDDRVISVIPIAQTSLLSPEYKLLSSPKGVTLILHGPPYPSSDSPKQSLNLTLHCTETASNVTFVSYEKDELQLEWHVPEGCAPSDHGNDDDKDKAGDPPSGEKERVGSGIGWFFLVILLAFLAYFCLGAYYNYSTYGASGTDLIPHRDFWKEVPYMLGDVFSHLCSSVHPRRSSRGYIAV